MSTAGVFVGWSTTTDVTGIKMINDPLFWYGLSLISLGLSLLMLWVMMLRRDR